MPLRTNLLQNIHSITITIMITNMIILIIEIMIIMISPSYSRTFGEGVKIIS